MNVLKMSPVCALLALAVGCSGKELDLGGQVPGTSIDGSTPGNDVALPSWPVAAQRNPRSLRSEGPYLYWIADRNGRSSILRCNKSDCANTLWPIAERGLSLGAIEIQGETLYAIELEGMFSCSVSACGTLSAVVPDAQAQAVAFDDASIYWSNLNSSKIYSCPRAGCQASKATVRVEGTKAVELAVDATALYWIAAEATYRAHPGSLMFAPKDGSAAPAVFASAQNLAASLALREGFVFWTTSFTVGTVARCSVAGCPADGPEILADHQYFPQFVNLADDWIFWMNGPAAAGDLRPVQVSSCRSIDCATTLAVLAEGTGGSSGVRKRSLPPREMVVDDDAVYWIGDVVNVGPGGNEVIKVDGSILRTPRHAR